MHLTNQQLQYFVNRIKLLPDKRADYSKQVDSVKDKVVRTINNMDNVKITRVRRAGSWRKGTILRPRDGVALDVDLVFFINVDEKTKFDAEELRNEIIRTLCEAYPNKNRSDFENGHKTVGLVFRGSGLEIDIVPFIPDRVNSSYGRQPRKTLNSGGFRTSIDKQLDFFSSVKRRNACFSDVVRMLKHWRNYKEIELPSFSIELLISHLISARKIETNIEDAIVVFFEFLAHNTNIIVKFSGAIGHVQGIAPIIADPTNNENNTLDRVSSVEWAETVREARQGFETISYARVVGEKGHTISLWKEIFGPRFNITEE